MLTALLENIFRTEVSQKSQDEFINGKTCLINITAFSDEINGFVHSKNHFPLLSALSTVKRKQLEIISVFQL